MVRTMSQLLLSAVDCCCGILHGRHILGPHGYQISIIQVLTLQDNSMITKQMRHVFLQRAILFKIMSVSKNRMMNLYMV